MTTSYRDKSQNILAYNSRNSESHTQFQNLSLNHYHTSCPESLNNQNFKRFAIERNTIKRDNGIFDGRKEERLNERKDDEWRKKDSGILLNNHYNNNNERNESKWDKENLSTSKTATTNKSTLSLYISAYEDGIEDEQGFKNSEVAAKSKKNIFGNPWNGVRRIFTNGSLNYPFEYARVEDGKPTVPEIMRYKASQQLLNPNTPNPSIQRNTRRLTINRFVSTNNLTASNESDKESVKSDSKSADTVNSTENEQNMEKKENDVRLSYTMPGALHFLQHEWSRAELERTNWEMERAELMARISFLQGERKGQENLKRDLVRRIKMLEYSLKQERLKIYRLTHNGEDPENLDDDNKPEYGNDVPFEIGAVINESEAPIWDRVRNTLKQYLEEFGYSENVVGLRNFKIEDSVVEKLLAGSIDSSEEHSGSTDSNILNKAFYGSKEEEEKLDSSHFLKDLAGNENEEKIEEDEDDDGNAKDGEEGAGEEEERNEENELDDALEALTHYSFLEAEKGKNEIDEHISDENDSDDNDYDDDEGSEGENEHETSFIVPNLSDVLESPTPPPPTTANQEAPSAIDQDNEDFDV